MHDTPPVGDTLDFAPSIEIRLGRAVAKFGPSCGKSYLLIDS